MTPLTAAESTKKTVKSYFQALAGRNLPSLLALFPEQLDWNVPGPQGLAPWLGKRSTRREVEEFFIQLFDNTEPLTAQIEHLLVDNNVAMATGRFSTRMRKTGKTFNSIFATQFTVENGLIVQYQLLEESTGLVGALTEDFQ